MKRRNFILAAAATPFFVSGCITSALNENISDGEHRTYSEAVDSVLISADGSRLVFLGAKYHYLFNAPEHFADLLASPLDGRVRVSIGTFEADESGNVSGVIYMTLDDVSPEELAQAASLGFETGSSGSARLSMNLEGKRYRTDGFDASKVNKKLLQKTYTVQIREHNPFNARKALYLLTPVTVAADGALIFLGSPLIVWAVFNLRGMRY